MSATVPSSGPINAGSLGDAGGRVAGGVLGGAIGGVLGGPIGAWIGRAIGSRAGGMAGRAAATAIASYMEDANEDAETETRDASVTDDCATGDCKPVDPCAHLRRGKGEGDYRGGSHDQMTKPTGDGKDSHHMPAKDSFDSSVHNDLPAIQMDELDHRKTRSNGNKGRRGREWRSRQRTLIEEGRYKEALQMDIDDAKRIAEESGDPHKYDEAIDELKAYAECREKHGLNKLKDLDAPTTPGETPMGDIHPNTPIS